MCVASSRDSTRLVSPLIPDCGIFSTGHPSLALHLPEDASSKIRYGGNRESKGSVDTPLSESGGRALS